MVIIDPRQRDSGIPTDAYFAVEEIKDVRRYQIPISQTLLLTIIYTSLGRHCNTKDIHACPIDN